ncbi:hypothetical protein C3L33_19500, partial [Rhododendron williamsianum]
MAKKSRPRKLSVYLYIPNIIGYIRVLLNCFAFYICSSNKQLFSVLYFISFVCDALDGWFARKFNQVSTFGAVLDMVTDRISTACLLVILSQVYRPGLVFLSLLALDIGSHWFQMYSFLLLEYMLLSRGFFFMAINAFHLFFATTYSLSTFLAGEASHKDVKDSTNWLFKAYYGNRIFMCYCCVACEVNLLYITLFLLAKDHNENLTEVVAEASKQNSALAVLLALLLVGWAIKQAVNFIQVRSMAVTSDLDQVELKLVFMVSDEDTADLCVDYDINKKQKA